MNPRSPEPWSIAHATGASCVNIVDNSGHIVAVIPDLINAVYIVTSLKKQNPELYNGTIQTSGMQNLS